ncbi:MAG TPA: HEAT repeat domain-containing protein [Nitrospirota bacterium]|nr:HEAT repeat domain-containing protein [Nitrospirota bacterium]
MQEETKIPDAISPEVQEVIRSVVTAIRAVKLYPPNNPICTQFVKKSFETLDRFLKTTPEFRIGVQKAYFTYGLTSLGKDAQLNKPIAQDLFIKGIREITFSAGLAEIELLTLLRSLALSQEELAIKSGISSILWEVESKHIKVTEAGLGEIITMKAGASAARPENSQPVGGSLVDPSAMKGVMPSGRTLVLSDLMINPEGFGVDMVEVAKQTCGEHESLEDRLFSLYQEAGRTIREKHPDQSDAMFEGLAQSALSLEPSLRDGLVGGKLYGEYDSETANQQKTDLEEQIPNELHEILSGRFSNVWNIKQVTTLLKKSSQKNNAPSPSLPSPKSLVVESVPPDIIKIAQSMGEYTPEEMDALKTMSELGQEPDIVEAAVRTLIFLLPQVKNPHRPVSEEKNLSIFSGIVHQLEDMLNDLVKQKDYDLASLIFQAFHMPVDPIFKPRLEEAIKKMASKTSLSTTISDLRNYPKGSARYQSAYSYLKIFERETTEALLEMLAAEEDRSKRMFFLDIVKDLGKNQLVLLGEYLADPRWYVVRNVVSILGETKSELAVAYLSKVADHNNTRIRQEIIKSLISIGGKKAAGLLAKYLQDQDVIIQVMAIRGLANLASTSGEESRYLMVFLGGRSLKKKEQDHTLEAIKALARCGGSEAVEFLKRYGHIRWWKPRKLQVELRTAAQRAVGEIIRRQADATSSGR